MDERLNAERMPGATGYGCMTVLVALMALFAACIDWRIG
jgi:hypothetical protein